MALIMAKRARGIEVGHGRNGSLKTQMDDDGDLNQLPVVAEGELAGLISLAQVLQLLQTRAELRI